MIDLSAIQAEAEHYAKQRTPAAVLPMPPNPVIVAIATDQGKAHIEEWAIDYGLTSFVIHAHDADGLPWTFTTLHPWLAAICDRAWETKKPIKVTWSPGTSRSDKRLGTIELVD